MNYEFIKARVGDWTDWCGQPMIYDGGGCVNRTLEERNQSEKYDIRLCVW